MEREKYVALYVRVSSSKQADEGYSIEAQEQVLRSEAEKRGLRVFKVYRDAGLSGAKADRPAFLQMIQDAKCGKFGTVGVWKISRLSRNLKNLLQVMETFVNLNIKFFVVNEHLDVTTAMGKYLMTLYGSIAEMQREFIRENTRLGRQRRLLQGGCFSMAPYGYILEKDPEDIKGGNHLVVEPAEAKVVKRMFQLFADGYSIRNICNIINGDGSYVGKYGAKLADRTLVGILKHSAYIGKVKFGGLEYKGSHTPIIDKELWDKVSKRIEAMPKVIRKPRKFILNGILRCPQCHGKMSGKAGVHKGCSKQYFIYVCDNSRYHHFCHCNSVKAEKVHEAVLRWLVRFATSPAVKRDLSKLLVKSNSRKKKKETQYLDVAKRKIRRLLDDLENGKIDADVCKQKITAIEEEMKAKEKANQGNEVKGISQDELNYAFSHMKEIIDSSTTEDKKKLIRLFIAEAHLGVDKKLEKLVVNIPSGFFGKENNDVLQAEVYFRKGGRLLWKKLPRTG